MPKLDGQRRLTIPIDFRDSFFDNKIALCYDNNRILLLNPSLSDEAKVFAFRKLDDKGRFFLPKEVLNILDASKKDLFLIYLQNGKVYMEKS